MQTRDTEARGSPQKITNLATLGDIDALNTLTADVAGKVANDVIEEGDEDNSSHYSCQGCGHIFEESSNFCRLCGRARYACSIWKLDTDGRMFCRLCEQEQLVSAPPGLAPAPPPLYPAPSEAEVGLQDLTTLPLGMHPPYGVGGWSSIPSQWAWDPSSIPCGQPFDVENIDIAGYDVYLLPPTHEPPAGYPTVKNTKDTNNSRLDEAEQLSVKQTPSSDGNHVICPPPALDRSQSITSLKTDPTENGCCVQWTVESRKVLEARDKTHVSSQFKLATKYQEECPGYFHITIQPKPQHARKGGSNFKSAKGQCYIQVKWSGETDAAPMPTDMKLLLSVYGGGTQAETESSSVVSYLHNFADEGVCKLHYADDSEAWNLQKAAGGLPGEGGSRTIIVTLNMSWTCGNIE